MMMRRAHRPTAYLAGLVLGLVVVVPTASAAPPSGTATHFSVVAPPSAVTGTPVKVTVTARDSRNRISTSYTGTVHFTSSDAAAVLPGPYTFTSSDNGQHTFSVTFNIPGTQTVTVTDTVTSSITGTSNPVTVSAPSGGGGGSPPPDPVVRLAGNDRVLTAIAVSQDSYPKGGAGAVVLARSDGFADALAGTPLAVSKDAPMLITASGGSLDQRVDDEIGRVLPKGRVVYILGGASAVDPSVDTHLVGAGYQVVRLQGNDRYATAVAIAHDGLEDPGAQVFATGTDFADALAGGAAAANVPVGGAILLTNGSTMPAATSAYISAHPALLRFALGGPAAAAEPTAVPIVGTDRFDTAVKVAQQFFNGPATAGIAYGFNYPDALAGGAHIGAKDGPLLLVNTGSIPTVVGNYLTSNKSSLASAYVYGGSAVVSDGVKAGVQNDIN